MTVLDAPLVGRVQPSALRPVFRSLRVGLHVLVVGLTVFVLARAIVSGSPDLVAIAILSIAFLGTYAVGVVTAHQVITPWMRAGWLIMLLGLWLGLSALTPDAAFLAFPLFFLELHVLPARWGVPLVAVTFLVSVWGTTSHLGFEVGSVLGPLISAGVAVIIGLGYRAMAVESRERQSLILDLLATREELAAASREAGTLAERERIAREIHDTVAQGLSSIQMLLHAAERDIADEATRDKLRLARETAADNLQETRRFIRELTPPALDERTLPAALRRLAEATNEQSAQSGARTRISFSMSGEPVALPMSIEATLLRIAQGSLSNVVKHSDASRAEVTLSYLGDEVALDVVDDGVGFDPTSLAGERAGEASFGLRAIRQRAESLGGTADVESRPGGGTALSVRIPAVAA
ncbi:sensor histidine kinase [Agromyces aurantiacus]|uniref:Oxygen sensor histidine kinase NreB n=1 Tax=Agromyces aurantiacus TaxID=165814 RepID=A0ABV9R9I1_9MICO|nr:sensor histidine kinase [Agromyces aurantiacus]MBM7504636.1 signal transduction histidine kinase [Agromyces aurantiacus]